MLLYKKLNWRWVNQCLTGKGASIGHFVGRSVGPKNWSSYILASFQAKSSKFYMVVNLNNTKTLYYVKRYHIILHWFASISDCNITYNNISLNLAETTFGMTTTISDCYFLLMFNFMLLYKKLNWRWVNQFLSSGKGASIGPLVGPSVHRSVSPKKLKQI